MNKLRLLQVCPCYVDLTNERGGVANIVRQLCIELSKKQFVEVTLICGNREMDKVVAQPGTFFWENIQVHVLQQHPYRLFGPVGELKKIIQNTKFDVAHVHTCFSAFTEWAMRYLTYTKVPFIYTPHGKLSADMFGNFQFLKGIWWQLFGRRWVNHSSKIIVSHENELKLFEKLGLHVATDVIINGFDPQLIAPQSQQKRIIDHPYILFLGYLDPRKQPEFLVNAFALSKASKTHKLVIAGPDKYGHLPIIRNEMSKYPEVADNVILFGPAYGDTKKNLLSHAALFVLPSKGEGSPVACVEAAAFRVPLLVSEQSNVPNLGGNIIRLNAFDASQWARSFDVILGDHQSAEFANDGNPLEFAWPSIADHWMRQYSSVISSST